MLEEGESWFIEKGLNTVVIGFEKKLLMKMPQGVIY
jgi:hypothetical protein